MYPFNLSISESKIVIDEVRKSNALSQVDELIHVNEVRKHHQSNIIQLYPMVSLNAWKIHIFQ